ncbi:MAG: ABC transporter ATP-binding protein [Nitratireductor sp.]|nr:ABC transporter ATP-binding protein [Nitratireductor sp.]
MTETLIRMEGVSKQFTKGVLAVQDMSLSINRGDFVSLLGPSGCGKSTALKMIAGLLPVTAGKIAVAQPTTKSEQDLGFVFQEPTLMPWASVFDNVWLPLRLAGNDRKAAGDRIRAALTEVGLSRFETSYPRELSGGMKMRVSIARALVTRPRILLMDEPFAALDEMTRMKLNNDVLRLAAEHALTVVFVTHSVFESVYLSNRVVVMAARPGRVAADVTIDEPWPRDESFRTSEKYVQECNKVSAILKSTLNMDDIDH